MNRRISAFIAAVMAVLGATLGVAHIAKTPRMASLGGGPTALCPFGWYQPDPNTSQCSTAFGWQPSIADASTNVFSIQGLTPNDDDFVTVLVKLQVPGATDETGRAWFRYKWGFTYRADASAFADPTGATTPTAVDSQIGSGLTGTTVTLTQVGSSLQIAVNCQSSPSCASSGSVDWFRNAPAPWVTAVSPSMAFASPTSPQLLTITTTPGGTNGLAGGGCIVAGGYVGSSIVTACPSGSLPLTGCTQQSQTTATCFLPAGSYTSGVDSVCLQSAANPFCLTSGFTIDAAGPDSAVADSGTDAADAADSSDAADAADAADAGDAGPPTISAIGPLIVQNGDTLVIEGSGFATGTNTANFGATTGITMTSGGSQCTGGSFTTDNCATISVPSVSVSGSAFAVSVTRSGGGTSGSLNAYSPTTHADCQYLAVASKYTTTIVSAVVSDWFDNTLGLIDFTQATVGNRPTLSTSAFVGTTPSVHFAGASHFLSYTTSLTGLPAGSQIIIIANTPSISSGTKQVLVGSGNSGVEAYYVSSTLNGTAGTPIGAGATTGAHLIIVTTGASGVVYQDGVSIASGNMGAGTFNASGGVSVGAQMGLGAYATTDILAVDLCSADIGTTKQGYWHSVAQTLAGSP